MRIVGAILRSEHSVLTVSTLLDGEYGLKDVCLSVPRIVSQSKVERVDDDQIVPIGASAMRASKIVMGASLRVYPGLPHGMCATQ